MPPLSPECTPSPKETPKSRPHRPKTKTKVPLCSRAMEAECPGKGAAAEPPLWGGAKPKTQPPPPPGFRPPPFTADRGQSRSREECRPRAHRPGQRNESLNPVPENPYDDDEDEIVEINAKDQDNQDAQGADYQSLKPTRTDERPRSHDRVPPPEHYVSDH